MCGWRVGWRFWRVRMSKLPAKLKLKLKLGLAILKNTVSVGWVAGMAGEIRIKANLGQS